MSRTQRRAGSPPPHTYHLQSPRTSSKGGGFRKGPEPLRRAIAECTLQQSPIHGLACDPFRTLQDYLGDRSSVDVAYQVLMDHALAERERNPQVMVRCVALLKKYLFLYIPSTLTLQEIEAFCMRFILEQQEAATLAEGGQVAKAVDIRPGQLSVLGAAASEEAALRVIKSLSYIRAIIARHLPPVSSLNSQMQAFSGDLYAANGPHNNSSGPHPLQSPMSRSGPSKRPSEGDRKAAQAAAMAMSRLNPPPDNSEGHVPLDLLRGPWSVGAKQWNPSPVITDSGALSKPQMPPLRPFLGCRAALTLLGPNPLEKDIILCTKVTGLGDPALARSHLRAIAAAQIKKSNPTASKEGDSSLRRQRQRPLFQYRYYSEQQVLRLSDAEMEEVISAVCGNGSRSSLGGGSGTPGIVSVPSLTRSFSAILSMRSLAPQGDPADVAASVLIKLVIDMYLADSASAGPLTLSILQTMLENNSATVRMRAFDIALNLGVHAHLLEPNQSEAEAESPSDVAKGASPGVVPGSKPSAAQHRFEEWLLLLLCEMLLFLLQVEEQEEAVWASGLSCLLYLTCDRGRLLRHRLVRLDVRVAGALLEMSRHHGWAPELHAHLLRLAGALLYPGLVGGRRFSEAHNRRLDLKRLEHLGGISVICAEYATATGALERSSLFALLLDWAAQRIRLLNPRTAPTDDEFAAVASALTLGGAAEAMVTAFRCPPAGSASVGALLTERISATLARDISTGRLNAELLGQVMKMISDLGATHTGPAPEFSSLVKLTLPDPTRAHYPDHAWATLQALLHSHRESDRTHGLAWLFTLLCHYVLDSNAAADVDASESGVGLDVGPERQRQHASEIMSDLLRKVSPRDGSSSANEALLPSGSPGSTGALATVRVFRGLLDSKSPGVRRGFVAVLDRLLLTAGTRSFPPRNGEEALHNREGAQEMLNLCSTCLLQMVAASEVDTGVILQMCNVLLSQICISQAHRPVETGDDSFAMQPRSQLAPSVVPHSWSPAPRSKATPSLGGTGSQSIGRSRGAWASSMLAGMGPGVGAKEKEGSIHPFVSASESMALSFLHGRAAAATELVELVPVALLYWPLLQLAPSFADPGASGEPVSSPQVAPVGDARDMRAALLLLLIGKCQDSPAVLEEIGGDAFFRSLLDDADARIAYFSSAFLLKRMMKEQPEEYQRALHRLVFKAQQSNNEKLLENPYLQVLGLLNVMSDL